MSSHCTHLHEEAVGEGPHYLLVTAERDRGDEREGEGQAQEAVQKVVHPGERREVTVEEGHEEGRDHCDAADHRDPQAAAPLQVEEPLHAEPARMSARHRRCLPRGQDSHRPDVQGQRSEGAREIHSALKSHNIYRVLHLVATEHSLLTSN